MRFSDNIISDLLVKAMKIQIDQDQQSKIWAFIDPSTEYGLPKTMSFGDQKFSIDIIDQFDQHRPQLMNYWSTDDRLVGVVPQIILDSNTLSYIDRYVRNPKDFPKNQWNAVHELVRFLASTNYDYNPFFYYLESLTKDESNGSHPNYVQMTESIIKLQSMNQPLFLSTGEIKPDMKIFQQYVEKFDTDSYPEMAKRQMVWMLSKNSSAFAEMKNLHSAIHISLLKMALIRLQSQKGIKHKHIQLRNYMIETLGIVLGRELYTSLLYFAGLIETFIPMQRGADFEKIRTRIKSATWDALLMRLPEFYLPQGGPEPVTIAYICTADKALQKIAKGVRIKAVLSLMPRPHSPKALLKFDYDELVKRVGNEVVESILIENDDWQVERWNSIQSNRTAPKNDGLDQISHGLENEMHSMCK